MVNRSPHEHDSDRTEPFPVGDLLLLVGLNLLPAAGVLFWGWRSFDLIFLYWMENLIIGAFTLLRMVVRPYRHVIDWVFPVMLAPFFAMHYGMFCWGHGSFVVSLFGNEGVQSASSLFATVQQALAATPMLLAFLALALVQAFDWLRDTQRHGLGADSIKTLMVAPYRRIVVLHLTILGGGFALAALDEPTVGLLLLVGIKTCSDLWHWRQERKPGTEFDDFVFTDAHLAEMQQEFPEPKVLVNGKERCFDSFAELQASKEYRFAQTVLRMMGGHEHLKAMNAYLEMKIAEEGVASTGP